MVGLGDLPGGGFDSAAYGVSADGAVVVGSGLSGAGYEAFRWTAAEGMVGLGFLPGGSAGSTTGVSADGSVVVGSSAIGGGAYRAFIWMPTSGIRNLYECLRDDVGLSCPPGWTLADAIGVSAEGLTIVGNGTDSYGYHQAWVGHIPEPATLLLVMLGVLRVSGRRGRNLITV